MYVATMHTYTHTTATQIHVQYNILYSYTFIVFDLIILRVIRMSAPPPYNDRSSETPHQMVPPQTEYCPQPARLSSHQVATIICQHACAAVSYSHGIELLLLLLLLATMTYNQVQS